MTTGFNRVATASEFRRPTSWGRTRSPKCITGAYATSKVIDVNTIGDATTITNGITGGTKAKPESGVYSTENQRYLHLMATGGGSVANIWVYSYAFGVWSELVNSSGASLTVANGQHKVFEIDGIDLVAFNIGANDVHAACSTF